MSRWGVALSVAVLSLMLTACGNGKKNKKTNYQKSCVLPADQAGSLTGRWKVAPIPISFKAGAFSAAEMTAITAAADIWNNFYQATQGIAAFDYGGASVRTVTTAKPTGLCSGSIVTTGGYSGSVVIYKQGTWPYSGVNSTIALTSFCKTPASPLPNMSMAIMEVNYQGFFIAGQRQPDLTSIFVHELGHLLGLDHSCLGSGAKTGMTLCSTAGLDPAYYEAVMYPTVNFDSGGNGIVKRDLQSNDQGRANCLYGGTAF